VMLLQVDVLLYCFNDGSCLVPPGTVCYELTRKLKISEEFFCDLAPRWFLISRVHGVVHYLVGLSALKNDAACLFCKHINKLRVL
jgi:hypothetical protein